MGLIYQKLCDWTSSDISVNQLISLIIAVNFSEATLLFVLLDRDKSHEEHLCVSKQL